MKVSLYEKSGFGHHLTYLRYFTACLLELTDELTVVSPLGENLSSQVPLPPNPRATLRLAAPLDIPEEAPFQVPGTFPNTVIRSTRYFRGARQSVRAAAGSDPGLVFIPTIYDHQVAAMRLCDGWMGGPWAALYLNARQFFPAWRDQGKAAKIFPPLSAFRARSLKALAILDEDLVDQFRQHGVDCPIITFPDITDPTPPDPSLFSIRQKASGRTVVSLLGHLQKSKGVATFLRAAEILPADEFFFVLAGEVVWETFAPSDAARLREIFAHPPENFLVLQSHISDGVAFNSLVHDADILFLAYENFPNSSNMLTKAALFERPVIASQGFCMGKRTKHFRLGLTVPEADPEACVAAIRQISSGLSERPDWAGYCRLHDAAALREALAKLLAAAL